MNTAVDSFSVLIIDENPDVLAFFARLLEANNIRALLAQNADDAVAIAQRSYVPIDLILANAFLRPDAGAGNGHGPDPVDRVRRIRPDVHALYMSAWVDAEVIRIELLEGGERKADDGSLIDTIRRVASRPRARTAG
jgi:CheY-like chemotaxis protein